MIRIKAGIAAWCLRRKETAPPSAARPLATAEERRAELARRMERLADRMTARQPASLGPKISLGRRRQSR
ncbi:MAG TPA: hypothetical protein VGF28_06850 [Thermoanaerobaculia bacterium]